MNKLIFILPLLFAEKAHSQFTLTIHQTGMTGNTYSKPIIAEYEDSLNKKINDSTFIFTCNSSEIESLFIVLGVDRKSRWFKIVWMDQKIKNKELFLNYSDKTAKVMPANEWDMLTDKTTMLERAGNYRAEDSISFAYLEKHTDSYLSLWFLAHGLYRDFPNKKLAALNMLDPKFKEYPEYKQTKASLLERKYPNPGDPFKEFELTDKNDLVFKSSTIKNKWILINLWSNGCGPCLREMDELVSFYKTIDTSKATFISIGLDDNIENWKKGIGTNKIIWNSVWQTDGVYGDLCLNYNLMAMPFFILFDNEKKIVYMKDGANEIENIKSTFKEKGLLK